MGRLEKMSAPSTSSLTAFAFAPGVLNTTIPFSVIFRDRNVVYAGSGAGDRFNRFGEGEFAHFGGADENGVGIEDFARDLVIVAGKYGEPFGGDFIERLNLEHVVSP